MKFFQLTSHEIGKQSENIAKKYLKWHSYNVIITNYKTTYGEIDIISEKNKTLIAFEVKYRKDSSVLPYSISDRQKERIQNSLLFFQQTHLQYDSYDIRFDAIFINQKGKIEHIENAWGEI